jgi:hypothetical protein
MKRWVSTLAMIALCSSAVGADVTVTSTMTMEGGAPGMGPSGMSPRMVMRIKGLKARSDVDMNGQMQSTIMDLASKQLIVLNHGQKTAQLYDPAALAASMSNKGVTLPKIDASSKPTGRSRTIAGIACDEYALTMTMNMADFSGSAGMSPEMKAMMKDVRMVIAGSMWVAKSGPGVSDFITFQRAAIDSNMTSAFGAVVPGVQSGGLDRLMKTLASTPGLPYLTELQMKVEGTGQMVDMMKQVGGMKIRNAVTEVSTTGLSDDHFQVPAGYTMVK